MKDVRVPGDKSLTHRALILAALATGRSRVRRPLVSADTRSTAAVLRALGCEVPELDEDVELVIDGRGPRGLLAPRDLLDCGNSGTTARLMMGVLSGHDFESTLTGDASLRARPMRRVTGPLSEMGARFEELEAPDRLPIRVRGGALRSIRCENRHASAQVKSAVLLAGLTGGVAVSVREPQLSRDHTERMLARLGVPVRVRHDDGATVEMDPVASLPPLDFTVPGDFSSAAFIIALACIGRAAVRVCDVGLNPARTGMLHVLERMGADVRIENVRDAGGEPIGDVIAAPSPLRGTRVEPAEIPSLIDEIPVLAVLAARAEGTTVIEGAAELRVKETDRIAAIVRNLRALGIAAEDRPDGLAVHGGTAPLRGRIETYGDHRIAMAFGILDPRGGQDIQVDEPGVVGVSFPGFWHVIREAGAA